MRVASAHNNTRISNLFNYAIVALWYGSLKPSGSTRAASQSHTCVHSHRITTLAHTHTRTHTNSHTHAQALYLQRDRKKPYHARFSLLTRAPHKHLFRRKKTSLAQHKTHDWARTQHARAIRTDSADALISHVRKSNAPDPMLGGSVRAQHQHQRQQQRLLRLKQPTTQQQPSATALSLLKPSVVLVATSTSPAQHSGGIITRSSSHRYKTRAPRWFRLCAHR